MTTNVPEFHDCQRLIGTENNYLAIAAVFASERLDSVGHNPKAILMTQAVAFVEVWAEGPYEPLGIEPGFNCLFLYDNGGTHARMVPVQMDEARCSQPFDASTEEGTALEVRSPLLGTGAADLTKDDIPPVARWDRDPGRQEQYIGVKCDTAWCEVGRPGFESSWSFELGENVVFGKNRRRTFKVKGWYDRQRLARYVGETLTTTIALRGAAIPEPNLERYTIGTNDPLYTLDNQWQRAATIALSQDSPAYRKKLNLTKTTIPPKIPQSGITLNLVEMCHGDRAGCLIPDGAGTQCTSTNLWWARITTADGSDPKRRYTCITYRAHPDVGRIPGTVRWRWKANDEWIWVRCPFGCCEVEGE